jgi:hypothetical protein
MLTAAWRSGENVRGPYPPKGFYKWMAVIGFLTFGWSAFPAERPKWKS